jgi:hypothetical protein
METARLSEALRGDPHTLIRIRAIFVPCDHGHFGRQRKDVFHAFRLTAQHESNKLGIGKAQPMSTRVGGGPWIVPSAGPDLVFGHTMSYYGIKHTISYAFFISHGNIRCRTQHTTCPLLMSTTSYTTYAYDIVHWHDMHIQTYNVVCFR